MISGLFIDRPKFAIVISLVLSILGAIAYVVLPVEQFPEITPPVVRVQAQFTGASAEVVEDTVAAPLEAEVNGVDGMLYMSSTSADNGRYSLDVTFETGTDPDIATVNTQNRVSQAMSRLPEEVTRSGVTTQKSSTNMLMVVALSSPGGTYDAVFLSNYASINIRDALSRVPGVGRADVMTDFAYGMRVWLDPDRLAAMGLTPADFVAAIRDQNAVVPAGQIGAAPAPEDQQLQYTVKATGRLSTPEQFEQIVLRRGENGALVTVGDVARVELGAQFYDASGRFNGKAATVMAIYQSPGANALAVAEGVRAELESLASRFPEDMAYSVPFDSTRFVESSMADVISTLLMTFALVVAVVFVFLGSARATLIPAVAIPVSLIGTFAILFAAGMSLNTVTLFALVLAIGIVVDDAIVVVENVERLIGEGHAPREATRIAMRQITGPVIATTLVLLAVFVPVTLMPGITGALYSQFAVTISTAVVISSVNALTLSPALAALVLRPRGQGPGGLLAWFERGVGAAGQGYTWAVARLARVSAVSLVAVGVAIGGIAWFSATTPTGFLPTEDQGYLFVDVQLPDAAALNRTEQVTARLEEVAAGQDGVADVITVNGFSLLNGGVSSNAALIIVTLTPWEERQAAGMGAQAILSRLTASFRTVPSAAIIGFSPPPIAGLGNAAGAEMKVQQTGGGSPQDLTAAVGSLVYAANQRAEIAQAYSTFRANVPQLFVDLDREKAKTLGVDVAEVFATLQSYLGSVYVNDFNSFGRVYRVMVQAEAGYRDEAADISRLHVRARSGEMVPLSTLVSVETILGPTLLNRYNQFRAATVTAVPAPGYSTGQAIAAMQATAGTALPPGYAYQWTGVAAQELEAGNIVVVILTLAILFAYLFLVAQYESWTMPVAILLSVTVALLGAYVAVRLTGSDVNLYTQIGMIMLVGLGAKNAILIVEFAMESRSGGASIYAAAVEAARLRFRAVMMTALSFLLGVVPLLIASGAGAASQNAIGIAVFGGMAAATTLGVLLVPVLYVALQVLREWVKGRYSGLDTGGAASDEDAVRPA